MGSSLIPSSRTSLLPALINNDRKAINSHLRLFKAAGAVRHDKTLQIPSRERIPALVSAPGGYDQVLTVLVLNLQLAFASFNLKRSFTEDQIIDLAELIIEESREDNLSMEDVLLFLQQLVTGKAGKVYERLDIPVFFDLFELYRQERHLALQFIQYEAHAQYKAMGDTNRTNATLQREELRDFLNDYPKPNADKS